MDWALLVLSIGTADLGDVFRLLGAEDSIWSLPCSSCSWRGGELLKSRPPLHLQCRIQRNATRPGALHPLSRVGRVVDMVRAHDLLLDDVIPLPRSAFVKTLAQRHIFHQDNLHRSTSASLRPSSQKPMPER